MQIVFNAIRSLTELKSLAFINVPLSRADNLGLIKNLLWWQRAKLEEISFISSGIYPEDLRFLFLEANL